jgi:hypothetical protein
MVAFWQQKYWPNNLCEGISVASAKPVDLLDAQSAFFVLCGGLCVSLALLLSERLYSWHKNKHITKVQPMDENHDQMDKNPMDHKPQNGLQIQTQTNGIKQSITTISNNNTVIQPTAPMVDSCLPPVQ